MTLGFRVPFTLALWMVLLAADSLRADQVRGVVRDGAFDPKSDLKPIAAALVRCRPVDAPDRQVQERTDADGRFRCQDLPGGPVTVEYEKAGYVPRPGVQELQLAGQAKLDLELYSATPESSAYWLRLAAQIARQEESQDQYVLSLVRLKGFGLPPEGLTTTAEYLARLLSPDQARRFGEQLAAVEIGFDRPRRPNEQVASLPPTTLTGQLTDHEGTPVPGVRVIAIPTGGGATQSVVTLPDGSYYFRLSSGSYDIAVDLEGSTAVISTVDVVEAERNNLDLQLPAASEN